MSMSHSGKNPTKRQSDYHNLLCRQVGCIACFKDGNFNDWVSIHHVIGRARPNAHWLVLPLCGGHHQAGTGQDRDMIAVHPYKARFEERYGSQLELVAECAAILSEQGVTIPEEIAGLVPA